MHPTNTPEVQYRLTDYESIAQNVAGQLQTDWQTNHYKVPEWFGSGVVEAYNFDHFSMMLSRFQLRIPARISRSAIPNNNFLAFDFIIHGQSIEFFNDANNAIDQLNYGLYISTPETKSSGLFDKNIEHEHLSLLISRKWLASFLNIKLPSTFLSETDRLTIYCSVKSYLVPTLSLLWKPMKHMKFRRQYFYGKCIEVISLIMGHFLEHERLQIQLPFHPSEIQKAQEISAYIQDHLSEKLTIKSLSQKFNINRDKLQQLFKQIYGKPIATYIRYIKMSIAYQQLLENHTVSEVGYMLGYTNLSHFSSAFRKVHGINPSQLTQKQ